MHIEVIPAPASPTTPMADTIPHVPDVILGLVLALLISLCTQGLANRHSRKQLKQQLDADASQRKIQREMDIRREVFLPIAEAVSRLQSGLGLLSDASADAREIARTTIADIATLSKAHAVAGEETVGAMLEYLGELIPATLELQKMRIPLLNRQGEIAQKEAFNADANARNKPVLELLATYNVHGNTDPEALDRLRAVFESNTKIAKEYWDSSQALRLQQAHEQLDLSARSIELAVATAKLIPNFVIAARRELGLPIDPDSYRRMLEEQQHRMHDAMNELIAELRAQLQQKNVGAPRPVSK